MLQFVQQQIQEKKYIWHNKINNYNNNSTCIILSSKVLSVEQIIKKEIKKYLKI